MKVAAAAPPARRLALAAAVLVTVAAGLALSGVVSATGRGFPAPTPRAECGPGARPEGDVQGRVPLADHESGRAARGYLCNTRQVAHQGTTGGFKVLRYTDRLGHTCAFYDASQLLPLSTPFQSSEGTGVTVLAMDDPRRPRVTTSLTTPTMLSPHESLLLNERRGLLAAVLGNQFASVGVLEIYDVQTDCRSPRLLSRTTEAVLGHESGWAPDGRTFYAASSGGQTFAAIDVSDPTAPERLFTQIGVNYHGMRVSDDGRTLFVANIGDDLTGGTLPGEGLRIIDVSEIQDRVQNAGVRVLSNLTWDEGSIPQVAQPFRRDGHDYLLEVDEFSTVGINDGSVDPTRATVGAARIIDVTDLKHPRVVSHLRLEVQQPQARLESADDPGASEVFGGYTGHYCSVPYRASPRLAACTMIGSGLRIFDISDVRRPREVAYFNKPVVGTGSGAFTQPAWDVDRRQVWYADQNSGFYVVQLINGVGRLLRR